jgi:membrane-associated phospholipid phosphatase
MMRPTDGHGALMLGLVGRFIRRAAGWLGGRPTAVDGAVAGPDGPRLARRLTVPAVVAAVRTRLWLNVVWVGALAFGALAWLVSAGQTASADLALARGIQTVQAPWFAGLMLGVSELGFPPLSVALVLLPTLALWALRRPLEARLLILAGGAGLLALPIKLVFARARPSPEALNVTRQLSDTSFPSGHTLLFVAFFGFLFYLAYTRLRRGWGRTLVLCALGALIVLVGPSRVYLGQHWPSDVLASYALGLVYLVLLVVWYARHALPRLAEPRAAAPGAGPGAGKEERAGS